MKTICRDGDYKVSASWEPLKVTFLVLFCSPSLPDPICPSVMPLWCYLMTPQSPPNLRSFMGAARVRSSPAPVKCPWGHESMRKDHNAESQQSVEMEQVCGWEQSCLLALREAWKHKAPSVLPNKGTWSGQQRKQLATLSMTAEVRQMVKLKWTSCWSDTKGIVSCLHVHFP